MRMRECRPRGGAVRFSEPHDHVWRMIVRGKPALYQNCVRMEATLKPFHSQNASFYPILIDIPDTFFGGLIDGWIVGMAPIHVIPHALLVTLVAQRPFRICSATRWITIWGVTVTQSRYKAWGYEWYLRGCYRMEV